MPKALKKYVEATQDEIACYAYYLWESEGRPEGRDLDYWLQAEAHLKSQQQDVAEARSDKTIAATPQSKIPAAGPSPVMVQAESSKPVRRRATATNRTVQSVAQSAFA